MGVPVNTRSQSASSLTLVLPDFTVQNLGAYIISATIKSTFCVQAMMCTANGGATARSLDNRGYLAIAFDHLVIVIENHPVCREFR